MASNFTLKETNKLIFNKKNARKHSDDQIQQLVASISEFGFLSPVIINGENKVIAGHGRLMAAKRLGLQKVPCIVASDLTEAQQRAYLLADNKLALGPSWDDDLLKVELTELLAGGVDADVIGFSQDEITELLAVGETLTEKSEDLRPIKWTRMLISIPTSSTVENMDDFILAIEEQGGRVDYGGN